MTLRLYSKELKLLVHVEVPNVPCLIQNCFIFLTEILRKSSSGHKKEMIIDYGAPGSTTLQQVQHLSLFLGPTYIWY